VVSGISIDNSIVPSSSVRFRCGYISIIFSDERVRVRFLMNHTIKNPVLGC